MPEGDFAAEGVWVDVCDRYGVTVRLGDPDGDGVLEPLEVAVREGVAVGL